MKHIALTLCAIRLVFAFEVVEVNMENLNYADTYNWPQFPACSIQLDNKSVYIPDGSRILVQSRVDVDDFYYLQTMKKETSKYHVDRFLYQPPYLYAVGRGADGFQYLIKKNISQNKGLFMVKHHSFSAYNLFHIKDELLVTGFHRTGLSDFLLAHRQVYIQYGREAADSLSQKFRETVPIKTVSFFSDNFTIQDSILVESSIKTTAAKLDESFPFQPADVVENGDLFRVKVENGYIIQHYKDGSNLHNTFRIVNDNYLNLVSFAGEVTKQKINNSAQTHSASYVLFAQDGLLLAGFYNRLKVWDKPKPPFYYDIVTHEGIPVVSGQSDYPVLYKDNDRTLFTGIFIEGGWFESDRFFLVGFTMADLIAGNFTKENIEASLAEFGVIVESE